MTRDRWALLLFIALALLPVVTSALDDPFLLLVASRILAFAIAAVALDLILGFGAMVSFGHAAYLGIGAYSVAILGQLGVTDLLMQMFVAMIWAAGFATITGAISLRTRGIYFIMITLAFSQMAYFFLVSFSALGGDDGTNLAGRSTVLGYPLLKSDMAFYLVTLGLLAVVYTLLSRLAGSRFGRVLTGTRENMVRMQAIGFSPFPYRLTAFVISACITALAGVLLANQAEFVSPSFMNWHRSGELIVYVVLGGAGTLLGPILGAIVAMTFEAWLATVTEHWRLGFGLLLILAALRPQGGIVALIRGGRR